MALGMKKAHLVLHNIPCLSDTSIIFLSVVQQSFLHVFGEDSADFIPEHVSRNSGRDLDEEDESQQNREGDCHAMILLDSSATSKESDEEDDASNDHQQHWRVEELVTQKVQVLAVSALNDTASNDECQPSELENNKGEV